MEIVEKIYKKKILWNKINGNQPSLLLQGYCITETKEKKILLKKKPQN